MKFIKKYYGYLIYLFLFAFALFTIIFAFSTNTYAYTLNSNGDLVSDNLLDVNSPSFIYNAQISDDNVITTTTYNTTNGNINIWLIDSNNNRITILDSGALGQESYTFNATNNISGVQFHYSGNNEDSIISYQLNFVLNQSYSFGFFVTRNESTHNYIISSIMVNHGSTLSAYEPFGTWYSQEHYSELQDNYDTLQQQYLQLKNRYLYGFFADLSELHLVGTSSGVSSFNEIFTLQDLIDSNYFSNGTFYLNNFISDINGSYDSASIKFSFSPNLIPNNVDISFIGTQNFNFTLNIVFSDNAVYHSGISNENNFIPHENLNNLSVSNGGTLIVNFNFSFNYGDYIPNMNFGSDYGVAYNTGFSAGQNLSQQTINNLENQITSLYGEISNMGATINTLQNAYNDLNQSYNNLLGGNSFANLFFTIAETPFASFKQIWNVDFLGVNLAGFVTGILFIGLIIWVIKKIF